MNAEMARNLSTDHPDTRYDDAVEGALDAIRYAAIRRRSQTWLSTNFWYMYGMFTRDQQDVVLDALRKKGYVVQMPYDDTETVYEDTVCIRW